MFSSGRWGLCSQFQSPHVCRNDQPFRKGLKFSFGLSLLELEAETIGRNGGGEKRKASAFVWFIDKIAWLEFINSCNLELFCQD